MKLSPEQLNAARDQLATWIELGRHPGWVAFATLAKAEAETFLRNASRLGGSPTDMALQLGSHAVASQYATFVERNIQTARQILEAHDAASGAEGARNRR